MGWVKRARDGGVGFLVHLRTFEGRTPTFVLSITPLATFLEVLAERRNSGHATPGVPLHALAIWTTISGSGQRVVACSLAGHRCVSRATASARAGTAASRVHLQRLHPYACARRGVSHARVGAHMLQHGPPLRLSQEAVSRAPAKNPAKQSPAFGVVSC